MDIEIIWKNVVTNTLEFEQKMPEKHRRITGKYFTHPDLAYTIIEDVFEHIKDKPNQSINDLKFFEPCVGVGSFVFAYLKKITTLNEDVDIQRIVSNIYIAEVDSDAKQFFFEKLKAFLVEVFKFHLTEKWLESNSLGPLLFDISNNNIEYFSLQEYGINFKFDIIVTNPPYKNLRIERRNCSSEQEYSEIKNRYQKISNACKKLCPISSHGSKNLYKYFIEEILTNYLSPDGITSLLVPKTILSDTSTKKLRSHILENYDLVQASAIAEKSKFVSASQALANLIIINRHPKHEIKLESDLSNLNKRNLYIANKKELQSLSTNKSVVFINSTDFQRLQIISKHKKLKDYPFIHNLRGELDMSLNKEFLTPSGEFVCLQGRNISTNGIKLTGHENHVSNNFLETSSKAHYIMHERIACQQISNMNKEKRLFFTFIEPNYVLANSINFIFVESNELGINLNYLYALFNSSIYNWFFMLFSTNNHISNTEIGELPVPNDPVFILSLSKLGEELKNSYNEESINKINAFVNDYLEFTTLESKSKNIMPIKKNNNLVENYLDDIRQLNIINLSETENFISIENVNDFLKSTALISNFSEYERATLNGLIVKYTYLSQNKVANNISYKLSDLDLEMIETVPQGGNWKDIRPEVVKKSKRLQGIAKSGGRTTLYGRLDYSKPSYTISTYFNRPGNGTYVHPHLDRVITAREAARLQSFDDNFYFFGSKTKLLKQIGNAVPPLLAYKIGKAIKANINIQNCLDLFCGAGGMSRGFSRAGINSVVASDIDFEACTTFKINHPTSHVVHGDITQKEVKEHLIENAIIQQVDIVCGGPPCQGFSNAGKRFIDDPRNRLFKEYCETIKAIQPKVCVMENVEGIMSFNKGETYQEILQELDKIGYRVTAKKLNASHYGVPQKRKRVIFIGVLKSLNIDPESIFSTLEKEANSSNIVTVFDAISDLDESIDYLESIKPSNYISEWIKL